MPSMVHCLHQKQWQQQRKSCVIPMCALRARRHEKENFHNSKALQCIVMVLSHTFTPLFKPIIHKKSQNVIQDSQQWSLTTAIAPNPCTSVFEPGEDISKPVELQKWSRRRISENNFSPVTDIILHGSRINFATIEELSQIVGTAMLCILNQRKLWTLQHGINCFQNAVKKIVPITPSEPASTIFRHITAETGSLSEKIQAKLGAVNNISSTGLVKG